MSCRFHYIGATPYRSRTSKGRGDLGHLFSEWKGIPSDLLRASAHTSGVGGTLAASDSSLGREVAQQILRYSRNLEEISPTMQLSFWREVGSLPFHPSSVHSSGIVSVRRRNGGNPSRAALAHHLFFTCDEGRGGLYDPKLTSFKLFTQLSNLTQ